MNPIQHLVLAVDFTDHSRVTLQSAIYYCQQSQSSLSLIHVIQELDKNLDERKKVANERMDSIVAEVQSAKIEVRHVRVITGSIEEHVVVFAENIKADAILVGSGNHHSKRRRLGGNAEAILRQSTIPVLIIKHMISPLKGKVACPIDMTTYSDRILETAIDYARHIHGEIVVIHAVEPVVFGFSGVGADYLYAEQNYFKQEAAELDEFLKTYDFKGVPWTKKLLMGSPAYEVSSYIEKNPFVMTIMGSVSKSGLSRLVLGSVAEAVARNVDSPCLIIKSISK